jgi:signal transduction histidine kinase
VRTAVDTQQTVLMARLSPQALVSLTQSDEHLRLLRLIDPQSLIAVPLLAHGKSLGVIALVSSNPARLYGQADVRLANELGLRAALAIVSAQLYHTAQRAIRDRDDVMGVVAHDLRNPLGIVLMNAAHLRRTVAEPEGRRAAAIERAVTRMNRLIQDLLDVTRMEAGGLSIRQTSVPTAQLVADAAEAQRPVASTASLALHVEVAPDLPALWADHDRLLQVFENLIGNAVKFTAPGGRITVGAGAGDGDVLFQVSDTGAGIAAEDIPHLFDRFWQAQKADRSGAGLGLPIVKGIVEAHGGRVWAESEPGRGSTFFFTIPTASLPG